MSHNIAGMPPFARMPLGGMGMGVGMGPNAPHPESNAHPHPPPPPPAGANPKKKRRTNANVAQSAPPPQPPTVQDLLPPPLSGYGDTIVASNPFDDTPPQSSQSTMMHGGSPHMHPHHPHHMGGPPMRGMSPLTSIGGMMPHNLGNMSPMGNSPMSNHMNHMGGMSPMNHTPIGGMSPMNNMGPNLPPGPMNSMNNHMNMSHMGNNQMSGPPMSSPMNSINSGPMGSPMNNMGHSMGSSMGGGPLGSPMNNMPGNNHNHMPNGPMNMNNINSHIPPNSPLNGPPSMNNVNSPLSHNGSQPHPNHMGNNLSNLGRPMNGPMTTMSSMVATNMNMSGPNAINNMNMGGPPINNMSNMNIPHHNQMGHMGGPMGSMSNNMSGGPPMGHPINMGGSIPPHGFQGPPGMGPKPMPVSAGKIYPPDQPMVFNSQNPNAPPIYPCGICHKEVHDNDQGILCESGCNFWFHRGCSGLSEAAFQLLTQEVYAEWVCDKCLQSKNIPLVKFKP